MTNNNVHLLLAFSTFFFIFVFPPVAMALAVIWIAFAYFVEDYEGN
jgi:hypothetical protein